MKPKPSSSSIADFCGRHNISEVTFYRHRDDMPKAIKIGGQWRIPGKAEDEWLAAKEVEFTQANKAAA